MSQCVNGHTRTEANTRWHRSGRGGSLKRVCLDCKTAKRARNGQPSAADLTAQRTTDRHEDVEDLLSHGATIEELVNRAGFSSLKRLRESLRLRERHDLLEQVDAKAKFRPYADLSSSPINGNKYTHSSFSLKRGSN